MNELTMIHIIDEVTEAIYKEYPILLEKYGERGRQKCREDNEHHLKHLQSAAALNEEKYFIDYAHWLDGILTSRGMKTEHLVDNFEKLKVALMKEKEEYLTSFISILESAIFSLKHGQDD